MIPPGLVAFSPGAAPRPPPAFGDFSFSLLIDVPLSIELFEERWLMRDILTPFDLSTEEILRLFAISKELKDKFTSGRRVVPERMPSVTAP